MVTGKLFLMGLLALGLAIGASSTASARSDYSFGFGLGAPSWSGYNAYPAHYYAPVVAYAAPHPTPYVLGYPASGSTLSFGYHSR